MKLEPTEWILIRGAVDIVSFVLIGFVVAWTNQALLQHELRPRGYLKKLKLFIGLDQSSIGSKPVRGARRRASFVVAVVAVQALLHLWIGSMLLQSVTDFINE